MDDEILKALTNLVNSVKALKIATQQLEAAAQQMEKGNAELKRLRKPELKIVDKEME